MASFQVIKGWNKPRNREKIKIIIPFRSKLTRNRKFIKNCKKFQKIKKKKKQLWLLFKQKLVGKGREREKIKIIVSFRSYAMPNRKFKTNSKKIQKIRRIPFWLQLEQK